MHTSYRRTWDTLVEIIADYIGLTKTPHQKLAYELHQQIADYIIFAQKNDRWDHLGTIFIDLEMGSKSLGQNLTPKNVTEMIIQMTMSFKLEPNQKSISVLDPAVGTGRFLLSASNLNLEKPLALFGIEIDVSLYRACLVNMALFSNHPFFIIRGDALLMMPENIDWSLANTWEPADTSDWGYKPKPSPQVTLFGKAVAPGSKVA